MDEVSSVACPLTAGNASIAAMRDASRSLMRWVVLGAASLVLFVLAAAHSASSVGAATPCIQINYTTCVNYTVPTYTAPTYVVPSYVAPTYVAPSYVAPATTASTGYPPNAVISTYYDPRYGEVSVVTDASGNLIDINAATGQRIYPVFPDNGYGFAPGFLGANYINGNIAFNGYNFANNYGYLNTNVFPAGGTLSGGVVYYNDNRFCGDGKVAFVPNRGYFCQNGGPLVTNGVNTINCGNFFLNGCGIWRGYEADAATPAAATQAQQVTTFAAPEAKAPVVAPAAPVIAPAAPVIAPAAPVVAPAAPVSAKIAVGVPGIAPVGGVQIDPSSR
jgi:hypothetical protein